MAIQTLRNNSFASSLGSRLGEGLGTGLGAGLQQLAQNKFNQIEQRNFSQGLQRLPGISSQVADFVASQPPELRQYALQNIDALMQLSNTTSSAQPSLAEQITSLGGPQQQAMIPQTQQQQPTAADFLTSPLVPDTIKSSLQKSQLPEQAIRQQAVTAPQPLTQQSAPVAPAASNQGKLIQDIFTSPKEKREQRKLEIKEQQLANQEKAERFKATKEERKEIIQQGAAARDTLRDLNRMQELEDTGKLDTPGYVEFLNRSGLDIPALTNPESQEFQKIANNFTKDAKNYFGGRVSNFEVEQFLKTVPSLSQSPEGRKRVIANLKYLANARIESINALKDVLKENKGVPPFDLLEQVDDRIEGKIESLSNKFKEDLKKPVPAAQNKLTTALQSSFGGFLGSFAKPAGGAVLGGLIGGLAGGIPGAITGARLGGAGGAASSVIDKFLNR